MIATSAKRIIPYYLNNNPNKSHLYNRIIKINDKQMQSNKKLKALPVRQNTWTSIGKNKKLPIDTVNLILTKNNM